jgi:hypothetical protein
MRSDGTLHWDRLTSAARWPFSRRPLARRPLIVVSLLLVLLGGWTPYPAPASASAAFAVLGWEPGVGHGISTTQPITVYFNRPISRSTVSAAWHLVPAVAGQWSWGTTSISFHPRLPFRANASYSLTVGAGATDSLGRPLAHAFSAQFVTGEGLKVQRISPAPGTQKVPVYGLVSVTFNHPMVPLQGLSSSTPMPAGWNVQLYPRTAGFGQWLGTSTWVFRPAHGLQVSTR